MSCNMSELTRCNYCTLQALKRDGCRLASRQEIAKLNEDQAADERLSGTVVIDRDGKFVAWFMALSDHCAC